VSPTGSRNDRGRLLWQEQEFLTIDDLARLLRVPKATIYRWRSMGEGPIGYSIGRHVRFRWPDIEAWLAGRADDRAEIAKRKMS
jgi:excisionase family DNA binding protein